MSLFVTVIVPTCNSSLFLERCLASIKQQNYSHVELIVVDENSTDATLAIAHRYASAVYSGGPERSVKRNIGITQAKGELVLIIDSDMELSPSVVTSCVEAMHNASISGVVIPEISKGEGFWAHCVMLDRALRFFGDGPTIGEAARCFRRVQVSAMGGYDPGIVGAEDWDLHNRMVARFGTALKIQSPIYHNEGRVSLYKRTKKKYYYSRAFRIYLKRYPTIAALQFSPFKLAYFRGFRALLRHPLLTVGLIVLKGGEAVAGLAGLVFHRR